MKRQSRPFQNPKKQLSLESTADMADFRFIDTTAAVASMIDEFPPENLWFPSLFLDVEGSNLSRSGTISLVTILVLHPIEVAYLVDVTKLGEKAFTTPSSRDETLQTVLESPKRIKVFYDIRHDSDALFGLFNVKLDGIHDLQLMELATRYAPKAYVQGLAKCIERDSGLTWEEKSKWKAVKEKGNQLFQPEKGGSYAVFDNRPLSDEMASYCVQDVKWLPVLWLVYANKVTKPWWSKIEQETKMRVSRSQGAVYDGTGQHMAQAPSGWMYWTSTDRSKQFLDLPLVSLKQLSLPLPKPNDEPATRPASEAADALIETKSTLPAVSNTTSSAGAGGV